MPAPGAGGGVATGIAEAIGSSLDQSAGKIAEALNGHTEVAVRIETSPDFIVKIERIVKDVAMRAINLTGPGLTGRSDTNVDQHQ